MGRFIESLERFTRLLKNHPQTWWFRLLPEEHRARIQTVRSEQRAQYFQTLKAFHKTLKDNQHLLPTRFNYPFTLLDRRHTLTDPSAPRWTHHLFEFLTIERHETDWEFRFAQGNRITDKYYAPDRLRHFLNAQVILLSLTPDLDLKELRQFKVNDQLEEDTDLSSAGLTTSLFNQSSVPRSLSLKSTCLTTLTEKLNEGLKISRQSTTPLQHR